MIYVDNVTMNYRIQQENIKSIKEYLVNVLRGKISYKEFCALNQVNLHINRGEVCGIVGVLRRAEVAERFGIVHEQRVIPSAEP